MKLKMDLVIFREQVKLLELEIEIDIFNATWKR